MTISRSSLATLVALAAGAVTSAAAQVPIQRPIQQAQERAATPAPAQEPDVVPGRRTVELGTPGPAQNTNPGTHIVVPGETLWALAQQYLGDPMLWPEIYRLNTTTIEDPHWIYPGEELRLSALEPPRDTAVVVQQNFAPAPADDTVRVAAPVSMSGTTIFSGLPARSRGTTSIAIATNRAYRAVREGEFFSAGFLTEGQVLNTGRLIRGAGNSNDASKMPATVYMFETITFSPPAGEGVRAGDLMLVFRRSEEIENFGQVVVPTGLVRVKGVSGTGNNLLTGTVVRLFGTMDSGQELLRVQPFVNNSNLRAAPVANGVEGQIVRMRDRRVVPQIQDVLFFDKGANDGLHIGDIIQLYRVRSDAEHGGTHEEDQGRAIVVNTRNRTSTAIIVELYSGDVGQQSQVRQLRRMPS